jgi:RNA polymerase sigma-70 factor (ECF subfamily)
LCQTYWYPLYAYIRRRGNNPAEAEDLTPGIFRGAAGEELYRGRDAGHGPFPIILLTSLKRYPANECDRAQNEKRAWNKGIVSLDEPDPELKYRFEPPRASCMTEWDLVSDGNLVYEIIDFHLVQLSGLLTL